MYVAVAPDGTFVRKIVYSTQGRLLNFICMLPRIVIDFFLNNQPDALIIQIYSVIKLLHISGILSARHQGVLSCTFGTGKFHAGF